ncbi:MAG: histidine phosphatase family protein [Acidobacteriota bacterium]|nr:histidine phosphatase family protein [Acidobacteriota bacterium]
MKILLSLLLGAFLFTFAGGNLFAQHRKLTVILLRHAEKDLSEEADTANPELSAAGKLRAQRLVKMINKYQPDIIYSSNYIRTKATVLPLAIKRRAMIFMYDPRNLSQIAEQILSGKLQRIVVVGHNNTTPMLANLLIGQEKYKVLAESEYDKIWIIKIKKNETKPNNIKDKVIKY